MVSWFSRTRKRSEVPTLRSRAESEPTTKVDLASLTPDVKTFLGKAAYLQLVDFENLSIAITTAPTAQAKASLSTAASLTLAKHHAIASEIVRSGHDVGEVMGAFSDEIDAMTTKLMGRDWPEVLVTCHITAGFLDDFLARLAAGLPKELASRVIQSLESDVGASIVGGHISRAIESDPQLESRLAMWGRRLVGDTMLIARYTLASDKLTDPSQHDSVEARIEPVFTELIASHTRRMDALGLTA
ncbi:MAG: ferritin-like fold-containing protein [Microbacteriaceae bacterium]